MKIFYDVDTQRDFMDENGKLYVPGAEKIKPNLGKLTRYALNNNIPIIGSVDRHFGTEKYADRETELQKNNGLFPDHCMDGTYGQLKIEETRQQRNIKYHPHRLDNKIEKDVIKASTDVYFEKQTPNVFDNPAAEAYLKNHGIEEAVVYGVATDICVRAAVLGLQERGVQCYIVEDAIAGVDPKEIEKTQKEAMEAGAKFVKTKDVESYVKNK